MQILSEESRALLTLGRHTLAIHCHQVSGPQIIDVGLTDLGVSGNGKSVPMRDTWSDTWDATDALGRTVAMAPETGAPRPNKTVGIFYFIANHVPGGALYDNTKLLAANPDAPQYGPLYAAHWWGQPWLGYYQSDDEAVIRKHMQMQADAGVDVIIFDNTNGPTYPDVYLPICKVLTQMRAQGNRTPQIAFFRCIP